MLVGERLKQLRRRSKMTQAKAAELLNISMPTYGRYERGDICISIDKLCVLADLYDVSLDYLLKGAAAKDAKLPLDDKAAFCRKYKELDVHARMAINALVDFEYQDMVSKLNSNIDAQV